VIAYDEFGLFHENVAEYGLSASLPPAVARVAIDLPDGRTMSALRWGHGAPRVVLVHGSAQNAHTWDTVALALGEPLIAVDLAGHGHSSWRTDGRYEPSVLAGDVAAMIAAHAPSPRLVVGMSLGGLTTLALAAARPDLVPALVMVDITPGVNGEKTRAITDFVNGPQRFASFDELLARTLAHNPTRSESSLRRGILHNARELPDGTWEWRYDRSTHPPTADAPSGAPTPGAERLARLAALWDAVSGLTCPLTLVRGGASPVVDDADVAELRRRKPDARVVVVDGASHSVQGDRPVELAAILAETLAARSESASSAASPHQTSANPSSRGRSSGSP